MGEVFAGRYELIDMIGEGGMGAVWRVRDLKRDRIVAAKVLRQSDAGSLLRFMREQGMRIHHPHVVTPLGWAGEDDQVLFTMPIVEGGSVSTLVRDYGQLPPRFAAELLRQLLAALDAVHSAGVVHRDIKPANLLLDATGTDRPHLWLTDFGVALATDAPRLTSLSVVMGTPGYLAPEQLRGADPDPVADLYAAGMVGFQLVTGHRPRPQMRTERLDLPPRPDGVPNSLWQLLIRLADPQPAGRPASAREALRVLEDPELAWVPQTEIEVFRHMPDLTGVSEGEFLRPGEQGATPTGTDTQQWRPTQAGRAGPTQAGRVGPEPAEGRIETTRPAQGGRVGPTHAGRAGPEPAEGRIETTHPAPPKRPRTPLLVLVLAPLLALLTIGALLLSPWEGEEAPQEPAGQAQLGGACRWSDAGSTEADADGTRLTCRFVDGQYRWQGTGSG
ncbi:serine/threonine protein kinase [Barrientosiimonas humi]|uniref:non-specific serine/threonine protein kinase n=1 Tax=Barrientosiimonas humi TaxID=999931 RepID=A0A542XDS9_9MICO|nr:serine/threonine-protein kinase [Barrientosiimonas humi]TQL33991.1 serine/threonine protein kinase [Barrientosiimonas humi]CAG7573981.1 Serine/threonine-protein kinase StkP [Barrientosiimonas humi]